MLRKLRLVLRKLRLVLRDLRPPLWRLRLFAQKDLDFAAKTQTVLRKLRLC